MRFRHDNVMLIGVILFMISSTVQVHIVEGLVVNRNRQHQQAQTQTRLSNHRGDHQPQANSDSGKTRRNKTSSKPNANDKTLVSMLAKAFRIMHDQGGTTAVLKGCQDTLLQYKAPVLVNAALMAGSGEFSNGNRRNNYNIRKNKGVSSGILNALLGCCCVVDDGGKNTSKYRQMAVDLMTAYDGIDSFEPDLVSLCLAYVATATPDKARERKSKDESVAETFLRRAEQFYSSTPDHDKVNPSNQNAPKTNAGTAIELSSISHELEELYGIKILQDSKEFVVLSKPSGMVCYHGENSPALAADKGRKGNQQTQKDHRKRKKQRILGGTDDDKSLEDCLLEYGIPLSSMNKEGRGLVHRIDRGTSGCLVLAKTNRMHVILLAQFFLRRSKKSYQALVCCSSDSQQRALLKTKPKGSGDSVRSSIVSLDVDGRPATSRYALERRVGSHLARLRVETEQGRRHQVRIHCSNGLGAPILLDPLYGGQSILSTLLKNQRAKSPLRRARDDQRFCLHASSLVIERVGIDVWAPLPDWWQELEEELQQS